DWPQQQKNHAAMITRMDRDIGRLMDLLKQLKIDNDTVVFFSSDNGPHKEGGADPNFFDSNGPLRGIKRDLYEGGIRVPMIVRWPGKIEKGRLSDQVWAFWDLLPTAAEIAGAKTPGHIDGISMLPAILGRSQKDHDYLYWEFHEGCFAQAVRFGKWKAVRTDRDRPIELYDIESDIGETRNLASEHADIVEKAAGLMDSSRTPSEHWPGK
ncbi:MAG: sulfatase-like hydrolase/transferase, partial [Armatimonadota bacterium]